MHLIVMDHRQQPSLNKTKEQPNNQLLTLATLLLNDIYYRPTVINTALSEVDVGDLVLELKQMKRMVERKTADNTMLSRLLQISCTMPVTSAASERPYICLKLIKTHLRTAMLDERLSSLAVLLMHSERINELGFEKVIDRLALQYPHCGIHLTL